MRIPGMDRYAGVRRGRAFDRDRGGCAARLGKGEPRERRQSLVAGQTGVSCEVRPEPLAPCAAPASLCPVSRTVGDEPAQGVLGADSKPVVELLDEVAGLGADDKCLGGCDEGAGVGEPDAGERPQAAFLEVGQLVERVVAAAMGVAGAGVEVPELAERGAPADAGAEEQRSRRAATRGSASERGDDGVAGELGGSHHGTITDYRFRNSATPVRLRARWNRTEVVGFRGAISSKLGKSCRPVQRTRRTT